MSLIFALTLSQINHPLHAQVEQPNNGNYIRLYHDLNGDGNYYNDNLRSYYLHFADNGILVDEGRFSPLVMRSVTAAQPASPERHTCTLRCSSAPILAGSPWIPLAGREWMLIPGMWRASCFGTRHPKSEDGMN